MFNLIKTKFKQKKKRFTNGLTDSMLVIRHQDSDDIFYDNFLNNLACLVASLFALFLGIFKIGRKRVIFLSYLIIDICLLGSLVTKYSTKETESTVIR